jgi:hypothetical protein
MVARTQGQSTDFSGSRHLTTQHGSSNGIQPHHQHLRQGRDGTTKGSPPGQNHTYHGREELEQANGKHQAAKATGVELRRPSRPSRTQGRGAEEARAGDVAWGRGRAAGGATAEQPQHRGDGLRLQQGGEPPIRRAGGREAIDPRRPRHRRRPA